MNGPLNAENLELNVTEDGQIVIEPGYIGYLRSQGYTIEEIKEAHTVKRSNSDTAHLVLKIRTYEHPSDSPQLDIVADEIDLLVCDCWNWRTSSADVKEGESPSECGSCVHIESVYKVEKAKSDPDQQEL